MRELGEAIDNHQFELADKLEESGKAVVVLEPDVKNLRGAISRAKNIKISVVLNQELISALKKILASWEAANL